MRCKQNSDVTHYEVEMQLVSLLSNKGRPAMVLTHLKRDICHGSYTFKGWHHALIIKFATS